MLDSPGKMIFVGLVCLVFLFFFGEIFNVDIYGSAYKYIQKWMR